MQSEDHYEMREYNIDVLQDEKDVPFYAKERPYPIYPSKKGLTPTFLGDIIARFVLHCFPFFSLLSFPVLLIIFSVFFKVALPSQFSFA